MGRNARLIAAAVGAVFVTGAIVAARSLITDHDARDLPGWHVVWADEFTGDALDVGRWQAENQSTFGDGNGELACLMNREDNVSVSGGTLKLTARREQPPLLCRPDDNRFPEGRAFSSAMLSTKGRASWTYGRFEVRARLPTAPGTSQGLWPAIWMRPVAGGPGELDIMEAIGTGSPALASREVHQTIWYDYTGAKPKQTSTYDMTSSPSADFHTYGVEWSPGRIRWAVDGVTVYERTTGTTPWLDDAFSRPFFLRLNLAVGGSWPGPPTGSTALPAVFEVDYVRVYRRSG